MKKALLASAVALGVFAPALQAFAEPYVGGSLGQSDIGNEITARLITSGPVDGRAGAFKLFSGYMFRPYVGIESAYVHFGDLTYSGQFGALPVSDGKVEASGFNIAVLGSYPLTQALALFGKLGVFFWDWQARDTTAGQPFATAEDGSDLSLGLGLSYSFGRTWAVRAEWERFKLDGVDADLLSIGLVWRF